MSTSWISTSPGVAAPVRGAIFGPLATELRAPVGASAAALFEPDMRAERISYTLAVPAFGLRLHATALALEPVPTADRVRLRVRLGRFLEAVTQLEPRRQNAGPRVYDTIFQLVNTTERPEADLIACTFLAAGALAGMLTWEIPELTLSATVTREASLATIGDTLRRREVAHWLLAIEAATGIAFALPDRLTGEEVAAIALAYTAITERRVHCPDTDVQVTVPLVPETESLVRDLRTGICATPQDFELAPAIVPHTILGYDVPLEPRTPYLTGAICTRLEETAPTAGAAAPIALVAHLRTTSGAVRYEYPDAPKLPDHPWSDDIQRLVDAGPALSHALAERYHDLAAATLAGAPPDLAALFTTPLDLGEDAFAAADEETE